MTEPKPDRDVLDVVAVRLLLQAREIDEMKAELAALRRVATAAETVTNCAGYKADLGYIVDDDVFDSMIQTLIAALRAGYLPGEGE